MKQETVAEFKHRIAIIMRERETGKRYSVIGASPSHQCLIRKPTDRGFYPPNKRVGSGQRDFKQNDSTGIVERPKTAKTTKRSKTSENTKINQ